MGPNLPVGSFFISNLMFVEHKLFMKILVENNCFAILKFKDLGYQSLENKDEIIMIDQIKKKTLLLKFF